MNRPPLPQSSPADPPDAPSMKATFTLALPEGGTITAVLEASRSSENAQVRWHGAVGALNTPPHLTDFNILKMYLEKEAGRTAAKLDVACAGKWIPILLIPKE